MSSVVPSIELPDLKHVREPFVFARRLWESVVQNPVTPRSKRKFSQPFRCSRAHLKTTTPLTLVALLCLVMGGSIESFLIGK